VVTDTVFGLVSNILVTVTTLALMFTSPGRSPSPSSP
jgi:hypothetical protein